MGDLPWEGAFTQALGTFRRASFTQALWGTLGGAGTVSLCHMAELGPGRLQGEVDALQSHVATLCSSWAAGLRAGWWLSQVNEGAPLAPTVPLRPRAVTTGNMEGVVRGWARSC